MTAIEIIESKLSDGSDVYSVRLRQEGVGTVEFRAISRHDAVRLRDTLRHWLLAHTNEEIEE
jgi:hypothetical protein